MASAETERRGRDSTVVVLTERWDRSGSEPQLVLRAVAGALALASEVVVVCTSGSSPKCIPDGVFEVNFLASRPRKEALKRALLLGSLGGTLRRRRRTAAVEDGDVPSAETATISVPVEISRWLEDVDRRAWEPTVPLLRSLAPDVVVVAGTGDTGLARTLEVGAPHAAVVDLPLLSDAEGLAPRVSASMVERAERVLVTSAAEHSEARKALGPASESLHDVGLAVPMFETVWREPVTAVANTNYLAVLCNSRPGVPSGNVEPDVHLLVSALPENPVAAVFEDRLEVWTRAGCERLVPLTGDTDLGRLLGWARMTVDLRPGRLLARQSIASLRYGTPVVVPEDSRAFQHARNGNAGVWYRDRGELLAGARLLLDPGVRQGLGSSASSYAADRYGSTEIFLSRVEDALKGLAGRDTWVLSRSGVHI